MFATVESIMELLRERHPEKHADMSLYHQAQKDGDLYVSARVHLFPPEGGMWSITRSSFSAKDAATGYAEVLAGVRVRLDADDWEKTNPEEVAHGS